MAVSSQKPSQASKGSPAGKKIGKAIKSFRRLMKEWTLENFKEALSDFHAADSNWQAMQERTTIDRKFVNQFFSNTPKDPQILGQMLEKAFNKDGDYRMPSSEGKTPTPTKEKAYAYA